MTAVLNWRGVPAYVLGLARGVAAIIGILATVAYPILQPKLQTVRTGLWSINLQVLISFKPLYGLENRYSFIFESID